MYSFPILVVCRVSCYTPAFQRASGRLNAPPSRSEAGLAHKERSCPAQAPRAEKGHCPERAGPAGGFANWLGIDPFLRAEAGAPGPMPARCQAPPARAEGSEQNATLIYTQNDFVSHCARSCSALWG